jgi:hypothetical protein
MKQIPVYDRGRLVGHTLVDDDQFDALYEWLWRLSSEGYVCRYTKAEGTIRMHREVLGLLPGDGLDGDHINGDKLDNRRANLRAATRAQNISNRSRGGNRGARSRYRGVSYCKQTGRWSATVTINRQVHWLGRHDTEEQAARVAAEFRAAHMPFSEDARRTPLVSENESPMKEAVSA